MSVYKEAEFIVESLTRQQKQIYSDAADYGVPIFREDDKVIPLETYPDSEWIMPI
jgi:hypothetical protein